MNGSLLVRIITRGSSLKKILVHPQKNFRKIPKQNPKNSRIFFWGFKIFHLILGVNNSSNSVFKSFFIHKILVHPKKSGKNPKKNSKNPKKSKDFILRVLWIFKIRIPYLVVNNPSIPAFKSFFIHKILVHPKKSWKKSEKIRKNLFWGFKILTPYLGVNNPSCTIIAHTKNNTLRHRRRQDKPPSNLVLNKKKRKKIAQKAKFQDFSFVEQPFNDFRSSSILAQTQETWWHTSQFTCIKLCQLVWA